MTESPSDFVLDFVPPQRERPTLLAVVRHEETLQLCRDAEVVVIEARDLEEGIRLVDDGAIGAVLLDAQIVGKNQRGAAKRLRDAAKNPDLPIVVLSDKGDLAARLVSTVSGVSLFLDKPLTEESFAALLAQIPAADPPATRIVIVDDDPLVLERYESELKAFNYRVRSVEDPTNLVAILHRVCPDVILLDVNLGEISGIDICRALRSSPHWRFLPILVFSSDDDPEMRVAAYQAGASDVLQKPVSARELSTRVHVQAERIQALRRHVEQYSQRSLGPSSLPRR